MLIGDKYRIYGSAASLRLVARFYCPDVAWFKEAFIAALQVMANSENWSVESGSATIDQAVDYAAKAYESIEFMFNIGELRTFMIVDVSLLPEDTLPCDGTVYERNDYPDLWEFLPDNQKTDTQFQTPNLNGRFMISQGTNDDGGIFEVGEVYGENSHILTEAEIPSHSHLYNEPITAPALEGAGVPLPTGLTVLPAATGSTGGGEAHNNIPSSVAVIVAIQAR